MDDNRTSVLILGCDDKLAAVNYCVLMRSELSLDIEIGSAIEDFHKNFGLEHMNCDFLGIVHHDLDAKVAKNSESQVYENDEKDISRDKFEAEDHDSM